MSQCQSLADGLCSPISREKTPPAQLAKCLSVAIELFLALLDDEAAEVRLLAEDSLARVAAAMADTHAGRLQVELYKEVKRDGSARRMAAALVRFAQVAPLIRPQKGRAYVTNLLPCLVKVVRRQEEIVHEALATAMPKIFAVLGKFQ